METDKKVEQAAARLRKSRAEYEEGEEAAGEAAGRQWVLGKAEYPLVQAMAEFELSADSEDAWYELSTFLSWKNPNLDDRDFADSLLGDVEAERPSRAWLLGFLEGAKEAWAEVEEKI